MFNRQNLRAETLKAVEDLLTVQEGKRHKVYKDSRGFPTVGIGHLVVAADMLHLGDVITDNQIHQLFMKDVAKALDATCLQMNDAGIIEESFVPALCSVNFQLGVDWRLKFPHTWQMIKNGHYENASNALDGTRWAEQTPSRVEYFQDALDDLPPKGKTKNPLP